MSDLENKTTNGVSRRTVTKAMAWAVPAVAVAASVPVASASAPVIHVNGNGCKLPGNETIFKGYVFLMSVSTSVAITVDITSMFLDGVSLGSVTIVNLDTCTDIGNPISVPAGGFNNLALLTSIAPNSQNGMLTINYKINGVAQPAINTPANGLNPIGVDGNCTHNTGSCNNLDFAQIKCILHATGVAPC